MIDIQFLKAEALIFRHAINARDKRDDTIISNGFPIGNCRITSLLLAFHYQKQMPDIDIYSVSGSGDFSGDSTFRVTHCWLEIDGYTIDVTGDQYNIMEDNDLNPNMIKHRPYLEVYVENISKSYLYELFECTARCLIKNDLLHIKKYYKEIFLYTYSLIQSDLDIIRSEIKDVNNMP